MTGRARGAVPELVAAGALALVCVLPYLLLGQDAYVIIHDNLDSEFVYLTNLVRSGTAFDYGVDAVIPNVMDGLPRSALRSGLNVTVVLFHVLPPFAAYVVNLWLVRAIAFVGMLLLLRRHLLESPEERGLAVALAALFALLPFYALYGVSVAGQPLLLWAYLELSTGKGRWWHWLVVALFPLYSLVYMSGVFVLAVLGAHALVRSVRERRVAWPALAPVLLLATGYAIVEWPLIAGVLGEGGWTSHRTEFAGVRSSGGFVRDSVELLLSGQYHAAHLRSLPMVTALAVAAPLLLRERRRWLILVLVAGMLLTAALHVVYRPVLLRGLGDVMPVLGVVQLDRFYFLLPLAWFCLFALALAALLRVRWGRWVVAVLVLVQAGAVLSTSDEVRLNVQASLGFGDHLSFREFFAPDLFESVRGAMDASGEEIRVVSVGLHPSIAQYNGLHTLDAYQNNYPLAYKHRYREVIADELAKDPALRRYFDDWGNRCYVFSAELGRDFLLGKDSGREIRALDLDVEALRSLGGTHVLSSVPIRNHEAVGLDFVGAFEHSASYWRIHLYGVR